MAERSIGSPSNIATGKVSVGGTAVQIVPARSGRRELRLAWDGQAYIMFLGNSSSVTTSNGYVYPLATGIEREMILKTESEIWAICPNGGSLYFMEIYD
jgi:hypothetical protein